MIKEALTRNTLFSGSPSGCDVTTANDPRIKPLIKFHNKVTSTFDALPSKGKILEVIKRVLIIVVSPFAYLALGAIACVASGGLAIEKYNGTS